MVSVKSAVLRVLLVSVIAVGTGKVASALGEVKISPIENSKKAVVTLTRIDSKPIYLSIENDNQSQVYYTEYIKGNKDVSKVFDFSLLPDGEYYLVLKHNSETIKKPITIENSVIISAESKKIKEPEFSLEGNILMVSSPDFINTSVQFDISKDNEILFSESLNKTSKIRKYDISQLPKGSYFATVADDYQTYHFGFERK